MDSALPLSARSSTRRARRALPDVLFRSPWAALVIPLLVPLVVMLV
jgi:hypothetical protein